MPVEFSIYLSATALAISAFTAWFTLLKRGKLLMTQPTVIYFGPDGSRYSEGETAPKVFIRTLLFSTGKRGHMIESMYIKIAHREATQNFNIWVYGDTDLVRGSGLFVGETGVATNHHFLTPKDVNKFVFEAGSYDVKLFAKTLGERREFLLWSETLTIETTHAEALSDKESGIYFDWGPDSKRYIPHVEAKSPRRNTNLLEQLITPSFSEEAESEDGG